MKFMDINTVPIISVSYNSAELIEDLLSSLRAHYINPITIIDGSSAELYPAIEAVCSKYADVNFIHFDYNIHHGPGMAWAFQNLDLHGPVLVLDSDVIILKRGFLESMMEQLKPDMYGVGSVSYVNEGGYDVDYAEGAIRYLHPACMLCNIDVMRAWPMPIKHGAPMFETMMAIHRSGQHDLIGGIDWVVEDFSRSETKHFLRHDWQGTVKRTGGYHLEEWAKAEKEESVVRLLTLSLMAPDLKKVVEIGANGGALARACKDARTGCHYTALEVNPDKRNLDKIACDQVLNYDVDALGDDFFRDYADTECWILDQALERLKDPDRLLARIRKCISTTGSIIAVIPNAQHWTVQTKLCIGDFRYDQSKLMHASHLRWFSRATIFELFHQAGFKVIQGFPVIHERLQNPALLNALGQVALAVGADPAVAMEDAQAVQYIVKAIPR